MPLLSRLMIRTALLWFAAGYTIGGLLLFNKGVPLFGWIWTLRMSHVHVLLLGWMVQFACGVAFWILPRLDANGARGNEQLMWLCYFTLNSGIVLAAFHDPIVAALGPGAGIDALLLAAAMLYVVAASAFVAHALPRIVAFRRLSRP